MQQITILQPDDWHLHLRDGDALTSIAPFTAKQCARAIVMPNLTPPVTTVAAAESYRERIVAATSDHPDFDPLMVLYLTNATSAEDIHEAAQSPNVYAAKLYPAGATTNSEHGVSSIKNLYPVFETMQSHDLPLLVHAEVVDDTVDVFDREQVFIDQHLCDIRHHFPELRVVLEHATTKEAIQFVEAHNRTAATLTPQHLTYNRNHLLVGGVQPHNYCLPVLKREQHRLALLAAATSGNPKFFLGTDSAPHATHRKESACGCAGCFTAYAAIELYAEVFESVGALGKLEGFASCFGPDFYGLERNTNTITLRKEPWEVPVDYPLGNERITPFKAQHTLQWKLMPNGHQN